MRVQPTGKACTRCERASKPGFIELDTLCVDCYDTYVMGYWRTMLDEGAKAVRAAKGRLSELSMRDTDRSF